MQPENKRSQKKGIFPSKTDSSKEHQRPADNGLQPLKGRPRIRSPVKMSFVNEDNVNFQKDNN